MFSKNSAEWRIPIRLSKSKGKTEEYVANLNKDNLKTLLKELTTKSGNCVDHPCQRTLRREMSKWVENSDKNKDGKIDFKEFQRLMAKLVEKVMQLHMKSFH